MNRTEWQALKVDIKNEEPAKFIHGRNVVFQFVCAHENVQGDSYKQIKNGNNPTSSKINDMERHSTGYKFRFTNLVVMYEEELSDYEVMEMCKRLNPNLEVPEVIDLIQQIELMLQSDETQRTMFFKESDKGENENTCTETCTLLMDGELAGSEFKWEFSPTRADPIRFFNFVTEPMVGSLTLLLRNQSRLVQLLEAKDQEIQDYTLNGAVLSRKSLQTTIFDSKKEALILPQDFKREEIFDSLRSAEYSEALRLFNASDDKKDIFIAPLAPMTSKTDLSQPSSSFIETARKRSNLPTSTASVMKGPKPFQSSQKPSQPNSEKSCSGLPQKISEEDSGLQPTQIDNCSSPQVKRTRSSRRSANASKNLLKKF